MVECPVFLFEYYTRIFCLFFGCFVIFHLDLFNRCAALPPFLRACFSFLVRPSLFLSLRFPLCFLLLLFLLPLLSSLGRFDQCSSSYLSFVSAALSFVMISPMLDFFVFLTVARTVLFPLSGDERKSFLIDLTQA